MSMSATQQISAVPGAPVFERVLCIAGASDHDAEAVRQGAALAGPGATVWFVAMAPEHRPGSPYPRPHQIEALVQADIVASTLGVRADPHIVETSDEVAGMLALSGVHDLLVASAGDTAKSAIAESPGAVLIARPASGGASFPDSILIAVDDGPEARAAARMGGRLAARHGACVALVSTPEHDAPHRRALQANVAEVTAETGQRPLVLDEHAPPAPAINRAAAATEASLIVIGSRPGHPAASVSQQVAREAGCSVLVLRGGPEA
jgi:nucleotide-binding universal stress UspA family protein